MMSDGMAQILKGIKAVMVSHRLAELPLHHGRTAAPQCLEGVLGTHVASLVIRFDPRQVIEEGTDILLEPLVEALMGTFQ
jgi:hypothetical protein